MADNIQAGVQSGVGPKFAGDLQPVTGLSFPFSKITFGDLHTDYKIVFDADGQRFPVKTQPIGVASTDSSATVTNSGTSQIAIAQNLNRKGGFIFNPQSALEPLAVDFGENASLSNGKSLFLNPGERFDLCQGGACITDAVNVTATTTGHAFVAKSFA